MSKPKSPLKWASKSWLADARRLAMAMNVWRREAEAGRMVWPPRTYDVLDGMIGFGAEANRYNHALQDRVWERWKRQDYNWFLEAESTYAELWVMRNDPQTYELKNLRAEVRELRRILQDLTKS